MKKNSFAAPTRQSSVAILVIIYNLYVKLIKQFWPLLLLGVANIGRGGAMDKTLFFIGIAAVFSSLFSLWSFFKYYFYIENGELVVEKGIFQKSKTNIPFERIQSINFEQAIIHRIFDVVKLKIDTAGSQGSELSLHALSKTLAKDLRDQILKEKQSNESAVNTFVKDEKEGNRLEEVIVKIEPISLLKIGATENHIRSGFLILFFGYWALDQIRELGFEKQVDKIGVNWDTIFTNVLFFIGLALVFIIASFIVSIIRVFFQYYDLKLERIGNGFRLTYGLFNQKQTTAKDHKIQTMGWGQNWLQKQAGLFKLHLKQASTKEVSTAKSIQVPGITIRQKNQVFSYLLKNEYLLLDNHEENGVNKHMFYYDARNISLLFLPMIVFLLYVQQLVVPTLLSLLFVLLIISAYKGFKKKKFKLSKTLCQIKGGSFGGKEKLIQLHKVQAVQIKQSWYQARRNLATLHITTAAENVSIPYLPLLEAESLADVFLYRVESSKKPWM